MNAEATKLQAAENDLKQLMADVTQAMEKAQEAVAREPSSYAATVKRDARAPYIRNSDALTVAARTSGGCLGETVLSWQRRPIKASVWEDENQGP